MGVAEPVVRRLGLDWCTQHGKPVAFCCSSQEKREPGDPLGTDDESIEGGVEDPSHPEEKAERQRPHNWGGHNSLRRYLTQMIRGTTHPFQQTGGLIVGAVEGDEAIQAACHSAKIERVPLTSLVASQPVNPQHIGLMLRGKAPEVRTGNHLFESSDLPTVVRCGKWNVLADGHHRATATWASGATHLKVRVLTGITPTFENSDELLLKPTA